MREIKMADYLQKKIDEFGRKKKRAYGIGAAFCLAGILGMFLNAVLLSLFPIGLLVIIWGDRQRGRRLTYISGMIGEDKLKEELRRLFSNSTLFTNVPVAGRDIDCLLVGPQGVWAIEAKNYSGTIHCTGDAWSRIKNIKGEAHAFALPSLSNQLKQTIRHLKTYLGSRGIAAWIDGIIVITNEKATLAIKDLKHVQAVTLPGLQKVQTRSRLSQREREAIEAAIMDLQTEERRCA